MFQMPRHISGTHVCTAASNTFVTASGLSSPHTNRFELVAKLATKAPTCL